MKVTSTLYFHHLHINHVQDPFHHSTNRGGVLKVTLVVDALQTKTDQVLSVRFDHANGALLQGDTDFLHGTLQDILRMRQHTGVLSPPTEPVVVERSFSCLPQPHGVLLW